MIEVFNPADGSVLDRVMPVSADSVDRIIETSRDAHSIWRRTEPAQRGRLLLEAARQLEARKDEFADLDGANTGRTPQAALAEVERGIAALTYYAGWADKAYGATVPVGPDLHAYTVREPYGVVVAITPWNVGFRLAVKKVAQALAFGNSCVLKPAPEAPLSCMLLPELFHSAGAPESLVQVAVGGSDLGAALVEHSETGLVTFTGSTGVGRSIAASAGAKLTPVITELGGKSPQLIFADADLEASADAVVNGVYRHAGQMCVAGSRVYVESKAASEFDELLAERTRSQVVGHPRDPRVTVGPQISQRQRDRTLDIIDRTKTEGTEVLAQAGLPEDPALKSGFYAPPTIFKDVDQDSLLMREEVFGPVMALSTFDTEEEALRLANDSNYGLAAGVWTRDGARAHRFARDLDSGVVWVNTYLKLSDQLPFGGNGDSGLYRENGEEAHRSYTRVKSVVHAI